MSEYTISANAEKVLKEIGKLAGVGEDWFELGEPDEDASEGAVGIYAKDGIDDEAIMNVMEELIANVKGENNEAN